MNNVQQATMNVNPGVLVCVRTANALLAENRVVEAKKLVERALGMEPNNAIIPRLLKEITAIEEKMKVKACENNIPLNAPANNYRPAPQNNYVLNDENYWDTYVRDWKKSEENKSLEYLGDEWGGKEQFVSLLHKYSNPSLSALEIGCGGGRITSDAVKWFKHLYATDVSTEMLIKCSEDIRENNISFHKIDGFTLNEFRNGSIDVVYSHDVFVHFSSLQVYPYFQEVKRVLRKGGICIVSFYGFVKHFNLFKERSMLHYSQKTYPPHMRVHYITEEMVRIMLKDLGMEVVEADNTHFLVVVFRKIDG